MKRCVVESKGGIDGAVFSCGHTVYVRAKDHRSEN